MNAREKILKTIADHKPALVPAPEINIHNDKKNNEQLVDQFIQTLESIGGKVITGGMPAAINDLQESVAKGDYIVNTIAGLGKVTPGISMQNDARFLEPVFKAYLEGSIGVAENGAVWLYETQMKNRLLPFICQHLVIVLDKDKIVSDMHQAYAAIDAAKEGYAVFLAGPSKTADIEQSLVIGAHGARSLLVYLV